MLAALAIYHELSNIKSCFEHKNLSLPLVPVFLLCGYSVTSSSSFIWAVSYCVVVLTIFVYCINVLSHITVILCCSSNKHSQRGIYCLLCKILYFLPPSYLESQTSRDRKVPVKIIWSKHVLAQTRVSESRLLRPVSSWVSSRTETQQPLWATCSCVGSPSQEKTVLCLHEISCI